MRSYWPLPRGSHGPIALPPDGGPISPPPYTPSSLESATHAPHTRTRTRRRRAYALLRLAHVLTFWTLATSAFSLLCTLLAHRLVLGARAPFSALTPAHVVPPTLLGALVLDGTLFFLFLTAVAVHALRGPPQEDGAGRPDVYAKAAYWLVFGSIPLLGWTSFALGVALVPRAVPEGFGVALALEDTAWGLLVVVFVVAAVHVIGAFVWVCGGMYDRGSSGEA